MNSAANMMKNMSKNLSTFFFVVIIIYQAEIYRSYVMVQDFIRRKWERAKFYFRYTIIFFS